MLVVSEADYICVRHMWQVVRLCWYFAAFVAVVMQGYILVLLICCFKDKFRQLLEINELVGGALDDTNPNRELIKEGKITKVSARDGAHLERYLYLVAAFVLLIWQQLTEALCCCILANMTLAG